MVPVLDMDLIPSSCKIVKNMLLENNAIKTKGNTSHGTDYHEVSKEV